MHLAVVALLLAAAPAVAAPSVSIALLAQAKVPAGPVTLGQVARVHADDLNVMRMLVRLPVGRAPAPGDVAILQKAVVAQWVRRIGLGAATVVWSGPEEGRVMGMAAEIRGEDIAQAALEAARAQLAANGRSGDVEVRMKPHDVPLPSGEVRLEVRGLDQASWPRRLVVWVDIWSGGWFVRTVPVGLQIVAGPGSGIGGPGGMPLEPDDASGAPSRPDAGSLAVARGDWAVLRSNAGAVALESRVEVLQDGRPGQKVRVRKQGADGPLLARVVGRGLLELAP